MRNLFAVAVGGLLLAACSGGGGGGGGVGTIPTPAPTPAPTTNTTIRDLKVSQTFTGDSSSAAFTIDRVTQTGITGSARASSLSVSYDAATNSYTISGDGRNTAFGPADVTSSDPYDTIYTKTGSDGRSYLTLVKQPYSQGATTQYVGLGFYQHNRLTDQQQETDFATFTYGLPTAAAAVPKTGTAAFGIDAFGAVTKAGQEPRAFQGHGTFSVDFAAGIFAAQTYLTESSLVSDDGVVGGGIELTAGGSLASNGSFSGNALYEGWFGAVGGVLNGRFYGPAAEELGASFAGTGADGMAVAGSFTGQRDSSLKPDNLTLTNMTQAQLFYTRYGGNLVGQLNWLNAETFTASPPTSDLYGGTFTINDKIAGTDPNFTTYRKTFTGTFGSQDVTLELFKPGSTNTRLALTYASFGHWATTVPWGTGTTPVHQYFAYGLETPGRLLSGRTGTGRYEGVVYGNGISSNGTTRYAVTGSSRFDVDFGAQSLSGALSMNGTSGGATVDFGSFDFSGSLVSYSGESGFTLVRNGQNAGSLTTRFYGPDGQEIAGPFYVNVPPEVTGSGIGISGVTAAKRQ